ncbi:hypothetical protein CY0110_28594, partial [Crocosphaera chwakensis CCY0110]
MKEWIFRQSAIFAALGSILMIIIFATLWFENLSLFSHLLSL